MRRSALDKLISAVGLSLAAILVVAGGLLTWASSFVNAQVHDQLAAQRITMPSGASLEALPPADREILAPYAGQEMTNGTQAKAFADNYILVHMNKSSGDRTYEEVSGEYQKLPDKTTDEAKAMGELRQSLFMGNTLRGMLLNAYAFGTMGMIAGIAAVAAFAGAVLMLFLSLLGFRHASRAGSATV
ncbi:hypothetical protein [Enemella evansiae]|uniref:Aromatic ring-opening dioxygenase LigA n=1 Tax=Enemella evansiae TaxID=2016499 RepID=A0A255G587_9ACTN|nr:hypothetical protein [Enemella evansiae]PFG67206.1 hypothetical protein B0O41_2018 [Propionibacteriaceae bacterium ES.041]OYN98294.1 hypothetical protein CGZ95_14035 [Enemella evansiae]OYN99234.1 hypothetical protein CGZ96_08415 [Enemella evansiae]OYO05322.1 hypothetical protein CGZ97_00855 [Enemella evansiae]OYO10632.1 hypothetical protein CGZ94_16675 [Enemella evansiae]